MGSVRTLIVFLAVCSNVRAQSIQEILEADKADRATQPIVWYEVQVRDRARREKVKELFAAGAIVTAEDLFAAAVVFQHGVDTDDYVFAHDLAVRAVKLDPSYPRAKWLEAATWDRLLISQGEKQWYGTQFKIQENKQTLYPIDPSKVTDEERVARGIAPMAELLKERDLQ